MKKHSATRDYSNANPDGDPCSHILWCDFCKCFHHIKFGGVVHPLQGVCPMWWRYTIASEN